jgi:hypothetical protein
VAEQTETKPLLWGWSHSQSARQDCLFLGLVMLLSLILYVKGLGFYDDDWYLIEEFGRSQDQSLLGLVRGFDPGSSAAQIRPVSLTYYAALYSAFGLHPFGYHLVNAAVLIAGVMLFYIILRELSQNRLLSLAIAMVYGLLPHYSTNRFWYAAFEGNQSMALYFFSLYCDLRMLKARPAQLWLWKTLSVVGLLGSTLAYEVFLPLFFLNPLVVLYQKRQLDRTRSSSLLSQRKLAMLLGSNLIVLMLVIAFKVMVLHRFGKVPNPDLINQVKNLVEWSITVSYRRYGSGLPRLVWRILHEYPNAPIFVLGGVLGLVIFGYLYRVARQSKAELPPWTNFSKLTGLGLVAFGLAIALLAMLRIGFSPAGPGNRTAIAAAVGVALSYVGILGWVCSILRPVQLRSLLFCVLIALLCSSGFLINDTIASFWTAAYRRQQVILADIQQHVPSLPAGSTLILDGVCPRNGPAVVFHSQWDLKGALTMKCHYDNIKAAVVTPNLRVREDGISTLMYGSEQLYPYRQLFVYHFGRKVMFQLANAEEARRYFMEFDPDYTSGCVEGREGEEVPIF